MTSSIFRPAAVERLSSADRLDQPIRITTPLGWLALVALAGLVAAACVAIVVVAVPVKVPGDGVILSPAGVLDVALESSGRLAELGVRPGDHVEPGAVVARLDQPELRRTLDEARAEYRDAGEQRERIIGFQELARRTHEASDAARRDDLERSAALIRQRIDFLRERRTAEQQLLESKAIPRQKFVDTEIELGKAEEELAGTQRQTRQIELDATSARVLAARELLDLELKVAAAKRHVELLEQRLGQAERVVSPYAGTVVELKRNAGDLVEQGGTLLSLLPDGPARSGGNLVVVLFVPAAEGKKIAAGMTVEVSPSTVKREEFGYMVGAVRSVAAIPSTEDGMMRILRNRQLVATLSAGGAPFEVQVELERDASTPSGYRWSSSRGPDMTIGPGTLVRGQVWVKRLRLVEIALPPLSRFFRDGA